MKYKIVKYFNILIKFVFFKLYFYKYLSLAIVFFNNLKAFKKIYADKKHILFRNREY